MPSIRVCALFRPLNSKEKSVHGDVVSIRSIDPESFVFKVNQLCLSYHKISLSSQKHVRLVTRRMNFFLLPDDMRMLIRICVDALVCIVKFGMRKCHGDQILIISERERVYSLLSQQPSLCFCTYLKIMNILQI